MKEDENVDELASSPTDVLLAWSQRPATPNWFQSALRNVLSFQDGPEAVEP